MEFVYVVPRRELFPDHYPQGFVPFAGEEDRIAFLERAATHGFYAERAYAETCPDWKQIIPYTVVCDGARVFTMRRLAGGGEARLHGKFSLGVGGHVNPVDMPSGAEATGKSRAEVFAHATRRELQEELVFDAPGTPRPLGLINDDATPVGAVHLGLVQIVDAPSGTCVRETDVLHGEFTTTDALRGLLTGGSDFESWSELLIDHLEGWLKPGLALSS